MVANSSIARDTSSLPKSESAVERRGLLQSMFSAFETNVPFYFYEIPNECYKPEGRGN
jgi:hypothetical protein